jgi:tetratricopeptide (TPR) repeat protein
LDGAIVTYRQCLTYHPNDAVALNDLGLCQARQGALDLAAKHLTKASCLHPENKRYANNLATVLVEQGKVNEALSALATSYGPAIAHYNLAHIQHRRGSYAAAVENLQVALKHDPSLSPAKQMIEALGGIETAALPPEPQLQAAPHGMESEVMGAVAPEPNLDLPLTSTDGPSTDVAQQLKRAQWNFLQGDKSRLAPSE